MKLLESLKAVVGGLSFSFSDDLTQLLLAILNWVSSGTIPGDVESGIGKVLGFLLTLAVVYYVPNVSKKNIAS